MTLRLTALESRDNPAHVWYDWEFFPYVDPVVKAEIERVNTAMVERLYRPLPAHNGPLTVRTMWGDVALTNVPEGFLLVVVGPSPAGTLGQAGPLGWYDSNGSGPVRSPGMQLGISATAAWSVYNLEDVVQHETLHGVGVMEHASDPRPLMNAYIGPYENKVVTPIDVSMMIDAGWYYAPSVEDWRVQVPWGIARLEHAVEWYRAGALSVWSMYPPG